MRNRFSPRICATIASSNIIEARRGAMTALAQGADLIEIRFDFLEKLPEPEQGNWCRELGVPVIATLRPLGHGGRYTGTEAERLDFLKEMARNCQYIDLEYPSANDELIGHLREMGARVILSHHDFRRTPELDELISLSSRCRSMGADLVKIAAVAKTPRDVLRLLELAQLIPSTVVVPMGKVGQIGRVLAPLFGSQFTYAVPDGEKAVAPGMLSLGRMKRFYSSLTEVLDTGWKG